jgi:hypothetical protein
VQEEKELLVTIGLIQAQLRAVTRDAAVVVVDWGNIDRTLERKLRMTGEAPICIISCSRTEAEPGKGTAIRRAVLTSNAFVVGYQDADLLTPVDTLHRALVVLAAGADVAIAVRQGTNAVNRSYDTRRPLRNLESTMFSRFAGAPSDIAHSHCGLKLLRGRVARAMFQQRLIDDSVGDVDVLTRAHQMGVKIKTLSVSSFPYGEAIVNNFDAESYGSLNEMVAIKRLFASLTHSDCSEL